MVVKMVDLTAVATACQRAVQLVDSKDDPTVEKKDSLKVASMVESRVEKTDT